LAVNKTEGMIRERVTAEFFELGIGEPLPISSAHAQRKRMIELALEGLSRNRGAGDDRATRPCVPASGSSAGPTSASRRWSTRCSARARDRVRRAGTTRDSIYLDFERDGEPYTLIDTAGRPAPRQGHRGDREVLGDQGRLQAIDDAHVVVLLRRCAQEIGDQDAHIAGFILEAGRALVVAVNKWDHLPVEQREYITREFDRKLGFLAFARHHYISAMEGTGVNELFKSIGEAYAAAHAKLPTPRLTRALAEGRAAAAAAARRARAPEAALRAPGRMNPPIVVVHGSALHAIPESYKRYLEHFFRDTFKLQGTPLVVQFKSGRNPFAGRPKRA
jgi:GTP-binding protein